MVWLLLDLYILLSILKYFEYTSITLAIISYGIAMAINFLLNFRLVFKFKNIKRAIFYCLVGLFGYALNAGFHLLYDNLDYII